jgi:anion-transporting  ArsA/GET3 family ATPase
MAAGRFGFKLFHRTSQKALQVLERISGVGFLDDISEFLMAFEGMSEGFRDRATRVRDLLLGPTSGFLLVSGPTRESTRRALEFLERMAGSGVPVEGVLMNRVHVFPGGNADGARAEPSHADLASLARALEGAAPDDAAPFDALAAAETATRLAREYASLVEMDARGAEPLRERVTRSHQLFLQIPQLERDISDVDGLSHVGALLFGPRTKDSHGN